MRKFFWYILYLLKYWLVMGILGAIVAAFAPTIGAIIFTLGLLGSFGAAAKDVKALKGSSLKNVEQELAGFEDALRLTIRRMS